MTKYTFQLCPKPSERRMAKLIVVNSATVGNLRRTEYLGDGRHYVRYSRERRSGTRSENWAVLRKSDAANT